VFTIPVHWGVSYLKLLILFTSIYCHHQTTSTVLNHIYIVYIYIYILIIYVHYKYYTHIYIIIIYIYTRYFASDITFPTCLFPGPTWWAPCSSRLLPGDAHSVGPVVGRRLGDGSLRFDGMDDWLGELYEGHKPRAIPGWGAEQGSRWQNGCEVRLSI
jgi:hypothetical protein